MERTADIAGATQFRGSRAVHWLLSFVEAHILGVPVTRESTGAKSTWWGDAQPEDEDVWGREIRRPSAAMEPTSFWADMDWRSHESPSMRHDPVPAQFVGTGAMAVRRPAAAFFGDRMTPQAKPGLKPNRVRFLKINRALHDVGDNGRWFALPAASGQPCTYLTKNEDTFTAGARTCRLAPDAEGGHSGRRFILV